MKADTAMGHCELYSESIYGPIFHTEQQAINFINQAIKQGYKGKFYIGFDDAYPEGLASWTYSL
jgi:hypothetical protein